MSLLGYPKVVPIPSSDAFGSFIFELCGEQTDRQTDRQTARQTDGQTNNQTAPNVLATPTDSPLVTDYMTMCTCPNSIYTCVSLKRKTTRLNSCFEHYFLEVITPLGQSVVRRQLDLKKIILRTMHTCHTFFISLQSILFYVGELRPPTKLQQSINYTPVGLFVYINIINKN